jgi:hypothetical protein
MTALTSTVYPHCGCAFEAVLQYYFDKMEIGFCA